MCIRIVRTCLMICLTFLITTQARATWQENGFLADPVAIFVDDPQAISDNYGGMIITWMDGREADYHIYAQRIDADGNVDLTCIKKNTTATQNTSGTLIDITSGNTIGIPPLYRRPGRGVMYPSGAVGSSIADYDYSEFQFQSAKSNLGF